MYRLIHHGPPVEKPKSPPSSGSGSHRSADQAHIKQFTENQISGGSHSQIIEQHELLEEPANARENSNSTNSSALRGIIEPGIRNLESRLRAVRSLLYPFFDIALTH